MKRMGPRRRIIAALVFSALSSSALAESAAEWFQAGQTALEQAKALNPNQRKAKNVILFVGDGMGISTVTAARIFDGQQRGQSGEGNSLSFEKLPYVALSKTYSTNQQTSDSAPTMTAMVTGVKTGDGILSVSQEGVRGKYATVSGNELKTILEQAEERGMSTGVVTTARLTHATPAACYAHTVERDWEADVNQPAEANGAGFPDIARQLIEFSYGDGLEVAMGGGRSNFIPVTVNDPEDAGKKGARKDGRDLTKEWTKKYNRSAYVFDKKGFDAIDPTKTDHLLGLFERSHMEYEYDRPTDTGGEPSLAEMTGKAIDILSKNKNGFFLMVEGGRIDHAHHAGNAYRALSDAVALADAVDVARHKVSDEDTLIIVTADHSHVFTIAGYPKRGNPILGKVVEPGTSEFSRDGLGLPYTTLSYANGPGYTGASGSQPEGVKTFPHSGTGYKGITAGRPDLTAVNTVDANYMQEAMVPLASETHAGEDVAIFAAGPMSHLFHGVQEQNYIYHVMAEALGLDHK